MLIKNNKILLQKPKNDDFSIIGGHVSYLETTAETLKREFEEELHAKILNANGVPMDCIREMLGHSSLSTTLGYIYNPLTESETYNLISKAL